MMYSEFDAVLIQTFRSRFSLIGIIVALILVTLIIEVAYYFVKKTNKGISIWSLFSAKPVFSQRLSLKQQITRDIIVIVILGFYFGYNAISIYNDISLDQYVQIQAEYSRTESDAKGNLFSNGHIHIEVDGEAIRLELPHGWTEDDFPEGTFLCTMWYSQDSKIALFLETSP